ncbi:MAG TPA: hypothetical protein VMB46_02295 [Methanomassiliicoccales archaeon]|nr:hypothetical protein [Methanomassiliicoccales archaeon]
MDDESTLLHILEKNNGSRLSASEIETEVKSDGLRCPDDLVRTLNRMRLKGTIKGELDRQNGSYVWWVD